VLVPVFGFGNRGFGAEGAMTWEARKPKRTMNGNARMNSRMSRLRVLFVMQVRQSGGNFLPVNHSDIDGEGDFI